MKKITITLYILFFITLLNLQAQPDKGLELFTPVLPEKSTGNEAPGYLSETVSLNDVASFDRVIAQETYVILVGNQDYEEQSRWADLSYVHKDLELMTAILTMCCKVKKEKILTFRDVSYEDFMEKADQFRRKLDPSARVIIYFSGHGREDGGQVFSDGKVLTPNELKGYVNSFPNDTVLIIDSCYAQEVEKSPGLRFKANCLQMYATLSYMVAKEVEYKDSFFNILYPFYNQILGITTIRGNGYFTSLLGIFFAEYKLKKNQNVSFHDLLGYMSSKCKEYLTYLNSKGNYFELYIRTEQIPIINPPLAGDLGFSSEKSSYILLQQDIYSFRPEGNYWDLGVAGYWGFSLNRDDPLSSVPSFSLDLLYNINKGVDGIWGIGIKTGSLFIISSKDFRAPFTITAIPMGPLFRYQKNWDNPLYFQTAISPGLSYNYYNRVGESERNTVSYGFYTQLLMGAGININKRQSLALDLVMTYFIYYEGTAQFPILSPEIRYSIAL